MDVNQKQIDRLVKKTQGGNAKAFGEIYDVFFPYIHKYVYYKISEEYVDDVVATVFIKAWTKINKYKKSTFPFSAWLFRIASNTVIDHYRTNKEFYELEERIADDNERLNPQKLTEKTLDGERVHRALRKIGKKYQEVILLRYMNDLSNREIAKIMKTNEGNVRTLQFRALKKLRSFLENQEKAAEKMLAKKESDSEKEGLLRRIFLKSS